MCWVILLMFQMHINSSLLQCTVLCFLGAVSSDCSTMLLKIGSITLLLALAVVSVVLLYYVKKKVQYFPLYHYLQMTT